MIPINRHVRLLLARTYDSRPSSCPFERTVSKDLSGSQVHLVRDGPVRLREDFPAVRRELHSFRNTGTLEFYRLREVVLIARQLGRMDIASVLSSGMV